jgi:hypothetical protein
LQKTKGLGDANEMRTGGGIVKVSKDKNGLQQTNVNGVTSRAINGASVPRISGDNNQMVAKTKDFQKQ